MTPVELSNPIYHDEEAARKHLEEMRWPKEISCPHCGVIGQARELGGESMGPGWFYCEACQDKFTVRTGTVYERSHIPLHKWLLAFRLMASSKKGISAHQLHRTLNITYKSAWFLAMRVREAMRELHPTKLGGGGKTVEADETFVGGKEKNKHASKRKAGNIGSVGKEAVFSLVERGGRVRSNHIPRVSAKTLRPILENQLADTKTTRLMTDGEGQYRLVADMFASHETVNHGIGEYVRGDVHTNTIEGYFSVFKRGITGTYHHVSEAHLKRYLAEFDFRYNERSALGVEDAERTDKVIRGAEGKRLTYRQPDSASVA